MAQIIDEQGMRHTADIWRAVHEDSDGNEMARTHWTDRDEAVAAARCPRPGNGYVTLTYYGVEIDPASRVDVAPRVQPAMRLARK